VRNPDVHKRVIEEIREFCINLGLHVMGVCESPLTGPEGNKEFFIYLRTP